MNKAKEGRHRSHQMNRLELVKTVSALSSMLALGEWTVTDAYVMGSQVSGGKPPHAESDLDLLFMINEMGCGTTPPLGLHQVVADSTRVLKKRIGREIHVQTVSPGSYPEWMKDINYKRVHWRKTKEGEE